MTVCSLIAAEPADSSLLDSTEAAVGAIGSRVRSLRTARGLALRELARRIGVTPSLLSQIERGGVNPSVGTLFRLGDCLGTTTDYFFQGEAEDRPIDIVVNGESRARIELSGGIVWERLTPTDENGFEFMHTIYPPGAVSAPDLMRHPGRDYGVLLRGVLDVTVGFTVHRLQPGDSIAFDASLPHRLSNPGPGDAETIWVVLNRNPAPKVGHGGCSPDLRNGR
jgi:transcriptional regulator with XRE-family HTH domain